MIGNFNDFDIYNYHVSLKNDLLYNEDDKIEHKVLKIIDLPCKQYIFDTKMYDLNIKSNYVIKKIYLKLDLDTYDNWLSDNNLLFLLFNTDIKIIDPVTGVSLIETKLLDSFIFNKTIKTDNNNLNNLIIDVYNFEKYVKVAKNNGLLINKDTRYKLIIEYSEIINTIIKHLYIDYELLEEDTKYTTSNLSNCIYFNIDKIVIDKNTNSFNFYYVDYEKDMYICIYIDSDNDDNSIEDITLNNYSSVSFHKMCVLGKTIYIIPLTFDLLDNLNNIDNYVYNNKNIDFYSEKNKIYNSTPGTRLVFKVNTTLDNYMSDIIIYKTCYYYY
jgi:hypothetical protein